MAEPRRAPSFVRSIAWNGAGNVVQQAVRAAQDFGVRALLPPLLLGAWEMANLVRRLGSMLELGFLSAAQRELPVIRARDSEAAQSTYRYAALLAHVGAKAVIAVAIIAWAVLRDGSDREAAAATVAALILVVLAFAEAYTAFLQSAERFEYLSGALMRSSIAGTVLVVGGTALFGFDGLLGGSLGAAAVTAIALGRACRRAGVHIVREWRADQFRALATFGIPLRVVDYPLGLVAELDLITVGASFGLAPLAIYGTAKMVFSQTTQVTSWFGLVMIVRLYRQSSEQVSAERIARETARFLTASYLVLLPLLGTGVFVASRAVIATWLPKYGDALRALAPLLATLFFVPQTTILRNVWILEKRLGMLALSNLVALTAMFLALRAAPRLLGPHPESLASGFLAGTVVYYLLIMGTVGRQVLGAGAALRVTAFAFLGAGWMWAVMHGLAPMAGAGVMQTVREAASAGVLALLALSPLVAFGVWQSDLVHHLRDVRRAVFQRQRNEP